MNEMPPYWVEVRIGALTEEGAQQISYELGKWQEKALERGLSVRVPGWQSAVFERKDAAEEETAFILLPDEVRDVLDPLLDPDSLTITEVDAP